MFGHYYDDIIRFSMLCYYFTPFFPIARECVVFTLIAIHFTNPQIEAFPHDATLFSLTLSRHLIVV